MSEKGDGVLIQPPVYHQFSTAIKGANRKIVENPLILKDDKYIIDFEDLEQKLKARLETVLAEMSARAAKLFEAGVHRKFVALANDLRKIYPERLPIPVSTRTLLFALTKLIAYPDYTASEAFKHSYNPGTIVDDEGIDEAIEKAVQSHDVDGKRPKRKNR